MIFLAIYYHLAMKKNYFAVYQYRDLHLKDINIVQKNGHDTPIPLIE